MKKIFAGIGFIVVIALCMAFRGQNMGESGYYFGAKSFVTFADTVYASILQYTGGTVSNGNLMSSDGSGNIVLSSPASLSIPTTSTLFGTPVIDSVSLYTTATKLSLNANTSYIITATSTFTSIGLDTFVLPSATTGSWIELGFNIKDSIIRLAGTGTATLPLTAGTKGTNIILHNYGGNWYF